MAVDNRIVLLANQSTDNASTNATDLYASGGANAMLCGELAINTNTGVLFAGADPAATGDGSTPTAVGGKVENAADVLAVTLSTAATTQAVGTGASPTFAGVTTDALTAGANLDIGAYTITGTRFISDIADGTAPLAVTSTTMIDNLNADMLDGVEATGFVAVGGDDMTGPLVLDDTSLKFEEGSDTLTITVPTLTASRAWTFPDAAGEVATTATAHAYVEANALTLTSNLTMDGAHIIVPTGYDVQIADAPGASTDAANKAYVDSVAQGLSVKDSVVAASTANVTISSLDAGQALDGITLADGDRVLLKNQSTASQNGIYDINADTEAATRSSDYNAAGDVANGTFVFVQEGTVNADSGWVMTTDEVVTPGTTSTAWAQFSGAGQIDAGDGLDKDGNTLDVNDVTVAMMAAAAIQLGSESFTDNDTSLMTSAAVQDKITAYSYITASSSDTLTNKSIVASQLTGTIADARMPNLTGDVTTSEGGVATAIASDVIVNADIKSDAAIATSKLADATQIDYLALSGNITSGGAVTFSGAYTTALTVTANTAITLPTSGTLVTTSATQTLTNKTLAGGTF